MWANIEKVYYGCNLEDNARIGFRDTKIEKAICSRDELKAGNNLLEEQGREECLGLFDEYNNIEGKKIY